MMCPMFRLNLVLAVANMSLLPLAAHAGGPWGAGWGFASHGGVPAQPRTMQSFWLNRSVVGYFVANNTGLASAEELAAEVKLGIVGIGWNLYHSATSKTGGIEQYEIEQAAALKKKRPDVGVMVLRNTEVVSTFWSSFRQAMNETDLWLQSPPGSGKPINEPWGTDDPKSGGPTPKYFLNFSNPKTQAWWLEKYAPPPRAPLLATPPVFKRAAGQCALHRTDRLAWPWLAGTSGQRWSSRTSMGCTPTAPAALPGGRGSHPRKRSGGRRRSMPPSLWPSPRASGSPPGPGRRSCVGRAPPMITAWKRCKA